MLSEVLLKFLITSAATCFMWSIFMRFRKSGSFTPWLQPGEQRYQKKGLIKKLNAKAEKDFEKAKHRAKAPV
ncbi:MAG: hypothetical protein ACOC1J_02600 [Prolixibacteraceae bacterium]